MNAAVHDVIYRAEGLSYRFEGARAGVLRNINFSISGGDIIGIVGPNGTGKSTLLNIMLGYLKNYDGSLELKGREISKWSVSEMAAVRGYISQENETGLKLSVFDYLSLSNDPEKPDADEKINSLLSMFEISHLKHRSMENLSGGESRLLQLAFAFANRPEILLLDEPVSYLDVNNQKRFFEFLKKASGEYNTTIVAILHDLNMAAYYCDKIMLLNNGELLKFDRPLEVLNFKTLGSIFFREAFPVLDLKQSRNVATGLKAHVVCGGGSGAEVIAELLNEGVQVSAGVLNIGDSDWNFCRDNNVRVIEEEPFKAISPENYRALLEYAAESDIVVFCDFAVGKGNLNNLKLIAEMNASNKLVISGFCSTKDFTGGAADSYMEKIDSISFKFKTKEEFSRILKNYITSKDKGEA